MPNLEYPLQDRLIDSKGMCPVYEEFKLKRRKELSEKPVADLQKKSLFEKSGPAELVPIEQELVQDKQTLQRYEEKGLISVKTLVMKNPEKRSAQEEQYLILFLRIKHANIFG